MCLILKYVTVLLTKTTLSSVVVYITQNKGDINLTILDISKTDWKLKDHLHLSSCKDEIHFFF